MDELDEHDVVVSESARPPFWLIGHLVGWVALVAIWTNVLIANRADASSYSGDAWSDWLLTLVLLGAIGGVAVWARVRGPKTGVGWGRHTSFVAQLTLWFASTFPGMAIANGAHVPGRPDDMEPVEVFRLFAWELSQLVPLVDIAGTLGWERPVPDNDAATGVMMLAAKALVVAVGVSAIGDYLKRREGRESRLAGDVKRFGDVMRSHRWSRRVRGWFSSGETAVATDSDADPARVASPWGPPDD